MLREAFGSLPLLSLLFVLPLPQDRPRLPESFVVCGSQPNEPTVYFSGVR